MLSPCFSCFAAFCLPQDFHCEVKKHQKKDNKKE